MKKSIFFALFLITPVISAYAKEFGLSVTYESLKSALEIVEVKALEFPELLSDGSTKEGASCKASGMPNPSSSVQSLCPGLIGQPGTYEIIGAANATVVLTHSADHTINGLRLSTNEQAAPIIRTLQLNASGKARYVAQSIITLVDKSTAKSNDYHFIFDISVAYQ
ncbi:hypothetical protein [Pseudoalteromonas sp. NC201]|uniref:hypothetical protein n=1 Tax=Pseudoalteromonas sp. NC201 TaxID=1514074 RepID=UPI000C7D34A4|nr:hypothetical protein [Pseudoalteromonas sp. NC201]AUJ70590.1 hypothetical protein PNC201_11590 [Pseudoalteromonas sp. NC201]